MIFINLIDSGCLLISFSQSLVSILNIIPKMDMDYLAKQEVETWKLLKTQTNL